MVRFEVLEKVGPGVKCKCSDPGMLLSCAVFNIFRCVTFCDSELVYLLKAAQLICKMLQRVESWKEHVCIVQCMTFVESDRMGESSIAQILLLQSLSSNYLAKSLQVATMRSFGVCSIYGYVCAALGACL